ncbi:MAG TPA: DUF3380 domain-containing protein [Bacteroidetes bacterium]|nr:DUF3380 domain-containing protein [Bacteroidota bacterium]
MKRSFWKKFFKSSTKAIAESVIIEVKGRVNASKLNIRAKPDIKSKVIGQLTRGQIVDVFNLVEDWYQIVLPGKKDAYVAKKYIEIIRQEKSGRIIANVLNVRSQPNLQAEILGKLGKGDIVSVMKEFEEWIKIQYGDKEGYIYKQFVEMQDVPLVVNPQNNSNTTTTGDYFYQRKDLATYPLEPKKKISETGSFHEKIAAKTWNDFGGLIQKISDELKFDVATGLSVLCVESSGTGFASDGKMIIRFENHVMDMFWGKHNPDLFEKHFKYDKENRRNGHFFRANPKDKWEACHTSQTMEWKVLEFARTLNDTAALQSISMGAPQVMGFNSKMIGYSSPQEMFEHFAKDIRYHLFALFDFCKYKPQRIRYLQKRDFYNFSVEYNGTAAPAEYEKRLLLYYDIFKKILP